LHLRALIIVAVAVYAHASELRLEAPLFRQIDKGCGAASLGIVLGYWADPQQAPSADSPRVLYEKLYSDEIGGIRLSDMKAYLLENGFHAFTMRATLAELEDQINKRRPVIVALRDGRRLHFTVVTGIGTDHLWLNDPARRRPQRMSRRRFERKWAAGDRWMLLAVPG
jgi:predicted double-glycine peptidase